ncbi:MAG: TIGR03619 family F420-dependent LLM class oxidoreductase [Acidimicrobiia bacterium]
MAVRLVDQVDGVADVSSIASMARAAEDAGFDAVWATDHPAPPDTVNGSGGHHALDPFVLLTAAAAATTRLRLLTYACVLPYRNPFLVAKQVASLDAVSRGRVILGVATGYVEDEFHALGVEFEQRNEASDDAIAVLRRAWTGEPVEGDWPTFRAAAIRTWPRPAQPGGPPIWVGGNSRRAMRRAVELGDGWMPFPSDRARAALTRTAAIGDMADLGKAIVAAKEHARDVGRTAPLDIVFAPLFRETWSRISEPDRLQESITELTAAGVTYFVMQLPVHTAAEFCDAAARMGSVLSPTKVAS